MATNRCSRPTWSYKLLRLTRTFIDWLSDLLYGLYYSAFNPHVRLPAVRSPLLLESATSLARKIRSREVKCLDLVETFITRITDVNPIINAMVSDRFEEARKDARDVDLLLDSGEPLSEEYSVEKKPFLGVPFTNKESIGVAGQPHTSGMVLRKAIRAEKDAVVITRMKEAGAIPLAVTNVPEACMWSESSNKIYGQSNNPYDTRRTPGGSSGGEGALLSACGSAFGIGSDIGGSIRMPAFFNGIFGHKPTPGLVVSTGHFPADEKLAVFATNGPMCRFAEDLIPMYKVLLGENAARLDLDSPVDLSSLKVHFALDDGGPTTSAVQPAIKNALIKAVRHLEINCGSDIQPVEQIESLGQALDIWSAMIDEAKSGSFTEMMNGGPANPFTEAAKWFLGQSPHTFPSVFFCVNEAINVSQPDRQAKFAAMGRELKQHFTNLLGKDGVFIYPTQPRTAPYHHQYLVMMFNIAYTGIFNVLGLPSTHVPLGFDEKGLPLGVQVVSGHGNDRLSLAVAKELQRAFGGWVCP